VYEKHCRYCQARISSNKGWQDNYCCEDHRVLFQERQHQETIERLRREEAAESELAIHTFEPRRVRVSMLGGSDPGPVAPPSGPGTGRSSGGNSIFLNMPPQVRVQPLVAPPLQPKASVEQGLAALASIAEPVSAPLQIPLGYANASPVAPTNIGANLGAALGATVRRSTQSEPQPKPQRKNDALVNLIRGANKRPPSPVPLGYQDLPVEAPVVAHFMQNNGARVRPVTQAPVVNPPSAPVAKTAPSVKKARVQDSTPIPKFLEAQPAAGTELWKRRGLQFSLVGLALSAAAAYFVFAGRADLTLPTPQMHSAAVGQPAPAKTPAPARSSSRVR